MPIVAGEFCWKKLKKAENLFHEKRSVKAALNVFTQNNTYGELLASLRTAPDFKLLIKGGTKSNSHQHSINISEVEAMHHSRSFRQMQ
jgi:hypothetical protein